jgi:hypothetical protein
MLTTREVAERLTPLGVSEGQLKGILRTGRGSVKPTPKNYRGRYAGTRWEPEFVAIVAALVASGMTPGDASRLAAVCEFDGDRIVVKRAK